MLADLATIYRRLPIKPLRGMLHKLYRRYQSLNKDRTVIAQRDGIKYELDLNERLDSQIYYYGCFEPDTVAIINKYVKEGMTAFDIGANSGCHTLRLAKLVGKEGKVIAFEPIAWAWQKLERNLSLNGFTNVILERVALSNEGRDNQVVHFCASWPLNAASPDNLRPTDGGRWMEDVVDLITMDSYVQNHGINRIDFIKLDVDGYEYKVIQGGINSIKKFRPVMIIEFGKYTLKEAGDSLEDLIDLLASLGYFFFSEENQEQYDKQSLMNAVPIDRTVNVLCKPNLEKI